MVEPSRSGPATLTVNRNTRDCLMAAAMNTRKRAP